MAAVVVPPSRTTSPVRSRADRPGPSLRVIPGGRSPRRQLRLHPAVYRRRRIGVLVVACTVVVVGFLATTGAQSLLDRSSAGPEAAPAAVVPTAPASLVSAEFTAAQGASSALVSGAESASANTSPFYVVRSGDTLWTIARQLHPSGDIRPVVDELVARHGGAALEVGDRLQVDGLGG